MLGLRVLQSCGGHRLEGSGFNIGFDIGCVRLAWDLQGPHSMIAKQTWMAVASQNMRVPMNKPPFHRHNNFHHPT